MKDITRSLILFLLLLLGSSCSRQIFQSDFKNNGVTPWTNLNLKKSSEDFSFAIVSDNSGGERKGVFEDAIIKLNRMRPDFVISIGDLIDTKGFSLDSTKFDDKLIEEKWLDLNSITKQLEVPFFYVVGNNDVRNHKMESHWIKQFGVTYYHFKYKKSLFIILNSEDSPGSAKGALGEEQISWLKKVLEENTSVKWTFVFLHRPMWQYENNEEWKKVEELLKNRPLSIFAGHHHKYSKSAIHGYNYYGLATTGGASSLEFGKNQFDHFLWVSLNDNIPQISNILLKGVFGDNPLEEFKIQNND